MSSAGPAIVHLRSLGVAYLLIIILCMHRSLAFTSLKLLSRSRSSLLKPTFTSGIKMANSLSMDAPSNKATSCKEDEDDLPSFSDDDNEVVTTDYRSTYQELTTKFNTEESLDIDTLQKGIPEKFYILSHASMPMGGFAMSDIQNSFSPEEIERLKLQPENVTVPAALRMLFPEQFTSQTRARKESRKRKILLHKGPLTNGKFNRDQLRIAKVGDRVLPGDSVCVQARMEHNYSESANHNKDAPFHLPVVYEDDYFALVNKPEGIVVFGPKGGGYGRMTVKSCLPYVITPPKLGVVSVLRRPTPVHRIDRGTSGLLVIAKTKPAMVELSRMFKERKAKKTYTAIVNGDILEPQESAITSQDAEKLGVCIGDTKDVESRKRPWQIIDNELEDQNAVTIWRRVKQYKGIENARNNTLSVVELKPKTGRYHQLRRHMAWTGNCPLLGDKTYDGGGPARSLRENGFYLCSNQIVIEHPFYNSPQGKTLWTKVKEEEIKKCDDHKERIRIAEESDGRVLVYAEIDLPQKFDDVTEMVKDKSDSA